MASFGRFDDSRREYVVTSPDTPMPWINYLGEEQYCSIVSHNAGGYSFRKSPGSGRLLRYRFNSVPYDRPGRYIYVRDDDGDFWSVSWVPVQKPLSEQTVTSSHGLGYTEISSRYHEISSTVLYLVPHDDPLEIWRLGIVNDSNRTRTLDIFGYAEFGVPEFARETDLQAYLYYGKSFFSNDMVGVHYGRARDDFADGYFACLQNVTSFDARREAFIGQWHDESNPVAVERGTCSGSFGNGDNPCGALHFRIVLKPGERFDTAFIAGSGTTDQEGAAARDRYTLEAIEAQRQLLSQTWERRLAAYRCSVPDADLNRTVGIWGPYQAHVNFKWSRSASFIEAGGRDGYGFRDTMQDTLGVMHTSPDKARELIATLLQAQVTNGQTLHSVQPLTMKVGQGEKIEKGVHSDNHLWALTAIAAYVRETGDTTSLQRHVPYYDHGEGTVMEHARRALDYAESHCGKNGMLLGLSSDWNDSLSGLWRSNAESIFVTMQYCHALLDYAMLCEALGKFDEAASVRETHAAMAHRVNQHAWDGQWYLRALKESGEPIGASSNTEGRIYVNPQTWSILGAVATTQRGVIAMDAVREHLATPYGIALCMPGYRTVDWQIGGMTLFPPGLKENAAIFCHPNPWAVIAETILRRGDRAFEYMKAFMPCAYNDRAELRQVEPYAYCQFVKGPEDAEFGQGRNSWLTGTASWAYVAATQYILGIRPQYEGLCIDPCIPASWETYEVERLFRGGRYRIAVVNPAHVCAGVREITMDGKVITGTVLPLLGAGEQAQVRVTMG